MGKQKVNMQYFKVVEKMREWYTRLDVIFNIIKYTKNREFAVLIPSDYNNNISYYNRRYMRCHSTQHFTYLMAGYLKTYFELIPYNLYISNGIYKDAIPMFSKDNDIRKSEVNQFKKAYHYLLKGNDLFIDIDAPEFSKVKYAAKQSANFTQLLDKYFIPYEVNYSGKGFHVVIPYSVFGRFNISNNPFYQEKTIYKFYTDICIKLSENYKYIDVNINDARRLRKVPFSISLYKEGEFVCMPIQDLKELENFEYKKYALSECMKNNYDKFQRKIFNEDKKPDIDGFLAELGINIEKYKTSVKP